MTQSIENRLKRLEGQLVKLRHDIAHEKDCGDVVPQFLAVKGALAAAYEAYIRDSLDACASADQEKMKRLITMLVKS